MSTAIAPPPALTAPFLPATVPIPPLPHPAAEPGFGIGGLRRFTVDEYHQLIRSGILTEGEPVELLKGYLVCKMSRTPQHDGCMDLFEGAINGRIPSGWFLRVQRAITLADSEPEPDYAVVRGTRRDFLNRHPRPDEIGLVVEISKSSLSIDTKEKAAIYAEASIPTYWVVNVHALKIEVFEQPSGPGIAPAYSRHIEYAVGDSVPVILDGNPVGTIAVADVMA